MQVPALKMVYLPDIGVAKFNYNAGVSLNVPIFHGKKLRTQEKMAAQQVEVAKWNTQDVKNNLQKEVIQQQSDIAAQQGAFAHCGVFTATGTTCIAVSAEPL